MNLVLLLVFATIVIKVTLCDETSKCCGANEVLIKEENSYKCSEDLTQRYQIFTTNAEFLKNSISGTCVDVFKDSFVKYTIDTNIVEDYKGVFFPKCCPLNRIYNTELHSCVQTLDTNLSYINETFVRVGLPNCKIIADFDIEGTEDYQYNLLNITKTLNRNSLQDLNSFCVDKTQKGSFVLRECQEGFESCNKFKCIKKCCPDGQSFVNGSKCVDTYEHGLNLSALNGVVENHQENYAIIHNRTCRQIYKMSVYSNITLHRNGSFTEWATSHSRTADFSNMNSYCIEHSSKKNLDGYYFFHCFVENNNYSKFDSRKWPLTLSCIFLVLTIVVYVVIKEYKKMFGKILINYCLTSFLVFGILLLNQMTKAECEIQSFILIFIALAQFTWANVMSFEIWCTFGTTKLYIGIKHKEIQLRKFFLYSLYAWGVPLIVTLTVLLFHQWRILPEAVTPYLANRKCFFEHKEGNYAQFIFFSAPLLIIQMINMVFFVKTVIYCMKVKNEINKINDATRTHSTRKYQHDKERLFLIIKLSIVMGISYIFEVVTGFFNMSQLGDGPKYIEIVLDIYNALQGVFIFIIFICKKKVILAFLQKFNILQRSQNSSSTRTQSSLTLNGTSFYFQIPIQTDIKSKLKYLKKIRVVHTMAYYRIYKRPHITREKKIH